MTSKILLLVIWLVGVGSCVAWDGSKVSSALDPVGTSKRELTFKATKETVSIQSPTDGGVVSLERSGGKMDILVSYRRKVGILKRSSFIEVVLDEKVVAKSLSKLGLKGVEVVSIDLSSVAAGQHKLQARMVTGPGIRGKTVTSEAMTIKLESNATSVQPILRPSARPSHRPRNAVSLQPILRPSERPSHRPSQSPMAGANKTKDLCDPYNSFLFFTGHDAAQSIMAGLVNVTWSPAVAYAQTEQKYLWCGEVTYDVFVVKGDFNFTGANLSRSGLEERIKEADSSVVRLETKSLKVDLRNLEKSSKYSIMVVAKTDKGHYSFNRGRALVTVSATDPEVKKTFTRMVNIPFPSESFRVENNMESSIVTFNGTLPSEVKELKPLDFVYFFDSVGNVTMAELRVKVTNSSNTSVWQYVPKALSDVFNELDMSIAVSDPGDKPAEVVDEADDEIDEATFLAEWLSLDERVRSDLCILMKIDNTGGQCSSGAVDGRRLFWGAIKKAVSKAYNVVKTAVVKAVEVLVQVAAIVVQAVVAVVNVVVEAVVEAAKAVVKAVADIDPLEGSLTFVSIDASGQIPIAPGTIVGVNFDASAKAEFSIKISLTQGISKGSLRLYGGFGAQGYISLAAMLQKVYAPEPHTLFTKDFTNTVVVGVVPVVLTFRPSVSVYLEMEAVAEGNGLVSAYMGYDYSYGFTYDANRSEKFQKTTSFTKRVRDTPDPQFSLRLRASVELGVTFQFDVVVYGTFQAGVAVDIALNTALAVGTNIDAMVVTSPYFYILDEFKIDLVLRIRIILGFNGGLAKIAKKFLTAIVATKEAWRTVSTYEIPTINTQPNQLPAALQQSLAMAKKDSSLADATTVTPDQLNRFVPDKYEEKPRSKRGKGDGTDLSLEFTVFETAFTLLGTPTISLKAAEAPKICEGNDAISLKITYDLTRAIIPFKTGLKNARWYANFDGRIFKEQTDWIISGDRTNLNSITLTLPKKTVLTKPISYGMPQDAKVYLRATAEIFPVPYAMYASASLKNLFSTFTVNPTDCGQVYIPPTRKPTPAPTRKPTTSKPTGKPTTRKPTGKPTVKPTGKPTVKPTGRPDGSTDKPSSKPSFIPTSLPSVDPCLVNTETYIQCVSSTARNVVANETSTFGEDKALYWLTKVDSLNLTPNTTDSRLQLRQRYALMTFLFQQSTTGSTLRGKNWLTPNKHICDETGRWDGVICVNSEVTEVSLAAFGMTGTVSADVGLLTSMSRLAIQNNSLSGPLPSSIGLMTSTEYFGASANSFKGTIPAAVGNWSKIQEAYFDGNELTGKLPTGLCQDLTAKIHVDRIEVNCTIAGCCDCCGWDGSPTEPPSVSPSLQPSVDRCHVSVSSYIKCITLVPDLDFAVGENKAMEWLSNVDPLRLQPNSTANRLELRQRYVFLSFLLQQPPDSLQYTKLNWLKSGKRVCDPSAQWTEVTCDSLIATKLAMSGYQSTKFVGTISPDVGLLTSLTSFFAGSNALSDTLPSTIGLLTSLTLLSINDNQLSGAIPNVMANWNKITNVNLVSNKFYGGFPSSLCVFGGASTYFYADASNACSCCDN